MLIHLDDQQIKNQADERKKRTLAAYDAIARSGVAGPKIVVREELEHMESEYHDLLLAIRQFHMLLFLTNQID